jgi:hypothetical protein
MWNLIAANLQIVLVELHDRLTEQRVPRYERTRCAGIALTALRKKKKKKKKKTGKHAPGNLAYLPTRSDQNRSPRCVTIVA